MLRTHTQEQRAGKETKLCVDDSLHLSCSGAGYLSSRQFHLPGAAFSKDGLESKGGRFRSLRFVPECESRRENRPPTDARNVWDWLTWVEPSPICLCAYPSFPPWAA
jgi:hypothetical protein